MQIDSHQHFWKYDVREYAWMAGPLLPLARDYLPEHLAPLLKQHGFDGCVAVQVRQTEEETRWMLDLARKNPFIRGVVGWVDLANPGVADALGRFGDEPLLLGIRHIVQDEPDDQFLMRPDIVRGIREVGRQGLVYDVLIYPRQLPATREFVRLLDDQPLVLDHLGKPDLKSGDLSTWEAAFRELGRAENLSCKVSGLVTEAAWDSFTDAQLRPCLDLALEVFGDDRLLFGSDWPVCTLAAPYERVYRIVDGWLSEQSPSLRRKILGENACRIYQLPRTLP